MTKAQEDSTRFQLEATYLDLEQQRGRHCRTRSVTSRPNRGHQATPGVATSTDRQSAEATCDRHGQRSRCLGPTIAWKRRPRKRCRPYRSNWIRPVMPCPRCSVGCPPKSRRDLPTRRSHSAGRPSGQSAIEIDRATARRAAGGGESSRSLRRGRRRDRRHAAAVHDQWGSGVERTQVAESIFSVYRVLGRRRLAHRDSVRRGRFVAQETCRRRGPGSGRRAVSQRGLARVSECSRYSACAGRRCRCAPSQRRAERAAKKTSILRCASGNWEQSR